MSELATRFEAATAEAQKLPKRPSNEDMLSLYAFFKQANDGDVKGKKPGMFDVKGRAKHDAWSKISGMDKEAAMKSYIRLVERLQR